jgi:hypothetical protein
LLWTWADEDEATENMNSEQADLVDVFFAPYVRPIGNLVILYAQAEAAWLELVIDLIGCTEKEALNSSGERRPR